jgi:hypothetical protein
MIAYCILINTEKKCKFRGHLLLRGEPGGEHSLQLGEVPTDERALGPLDALGQRLAEAIQVELVSAAAFGIRGLLIVFIHVVLAAIFTVFFNRFGMPFNWISIWIKP